MSRKRYGRRVQRRPRGMHVGLISSGSSLTLEQRTRLTRAIAQIDFNNPGQLTLHLGCGHGADRVAHQAASQHGRWRIHGHPATDVTGRPRRLTVGYRIDALEAAKTRRQRDLDIVRACDTILLVVPYVEDASEPASRASG